MNKQIYNDKEISIKRDAQIEGNLIITLIPENWIFEISEKLLLEKVKSFCSPELSLYVWDLYMERQIELLQEIGE